MPPPAAHALPVNQIMGAIAERLTLGLGKSVKKVAPYLGELEDLSSAIASFPAAWVAFLGIDKTEALDIRKTRFRAHGQFSVMVGVQTMRGGDALIKGGPTLVEVGAGTLTHMVRQLLAGQSLGLKIGQLTATRVKNLANTKINAQAASVYACEFTTYWQETTLADGDWPLSDEVFAEYQGKTQSAKPEMTSIHARYFAGEQSTPIITDKIKI